MGTEAHLRTWRQGLHKDAHNAEGVRTEFEARRELYMFIDPIPHISTG